MKKRALAYVNSLRLIHEEVLKKLSEMPDGLHRADTRYWECIEYIASVRKRLNTLKPTVSNAGRVAFRHYEAEILPKLEEMRAKLGNPTLGKKSETTTSVAAEVQVSGIEKLEALKRELSRAQEEDAKQVSVKKQESQALGPEEARVITGVSEYSDMTRALEVARRLFRKTSNPKRA